MNSVIDKCNMQVAISSFNCEVKVGNKNKTAKYYRKKAINLIISQKNAKFASPYFIYRYIAEYVVTPKDF